TLLNIALSRGDLEVARTAFQEFERIGLQLNQPLYLEVRSRFTTIDQVRLWLACGQLDQATRWAEELDIIERHIAPFAREREGASMASLFYQLRKQKRKHGPTPYLDTVIAAFQQESLACVPAGEPTKTQPLPEPLSGREREVLQLLARGASNLEIAQELVIAIDTVKRHVSHIFSKLGVKNRLQAVKHARELD